MHEIVIDPKYVCNCRCHYKNIPNDFLFISDHCCQNSYIKYINDDGTLDLEIYNNILKSEKHDNNNIPYIDFGEYIVKKKSDYNTAYIKEKRRNIK